jgi:integrase
VRQERPVWISLAKRNGTYGHPLSIRAIALINEQRLGASKVHTLRHTFARGLEDAGAKVSEIQARLGHADLGTTGRYLAQLHAGENPHLARLSHLYGLEDRLKRQPEPAPDEK